MPTPTPASHARSHAPDPRLARTLWQWLALGVVAMLLVPAARGPVYLLGNMPFWLLIAPASALLILHRHALAAAWRTARAPRRRFPAVRRGRRGACVRGAAGTLP